MSANVETMMYDDRRKLPWHGLGTAVNEAPTSVDALRLSGLDWIVEQFPLFAHKTMRSIDFADPGTITEIIQDIGIPNWFANVRNTDNAVLGVVSKQYKIIQNVDAFSFVDELLGMGGQEVHYETAGSLSGGRTVWLLAKMPGREILGDLINPYLCFTNSHDGRNSAKGFVTPIRVVCWNTLNAAMRGAKRTWSITHVGDIAYKVQEARRALDIAGIYMDALSKSAESLAKVHLTDTNAVHVAETLLPITDDMSEVKEQMVQQDRALLLSVYRNRADLSNIRGTGWGMLNAVADFVDHRPFGPTTTITRRTYERKFESIISGHELLDSAFALINALA